MSKKGDLSPCKKAEVKALVNAKLFSNREISQKLKVSEASVRHIKKKIESGEELSPKRKKNGAGSLFSPKNKTQFVRRHDGEKFHSDCCSDCETPYKNNDLVSHQWQGSWTSVRS
ncbi:hypothetical protein TNCV_2333561 [Trichonephila clavipes]|nr:hypothetical protein TNCV_2333561 [Trichonephila clavipes]